MEHETELLPSYADDATRQGPGPMGADATAERPVAEPAPPGDGPPADEAAPTSGAGRRPWLGRAAVLAVVAMIAGATGAGVTLALDDDPVSSAGTATPVRSAFALDGDALDVAGVVAKVGPSVVAIQATSNLGGGSGTGVVLSADGEILTNAHVVAGATTIRVTLPGEAQARGAELVGLDTDADLALLQLSDVSGLTPAELGDSSEVVVGDDVVAIGNALALRGGPTVTRGIISALDRSVEAGESVMTGLLQTDASISSGNSGGPLVNAAGQVIGINTAVAASTGLRSAENVGFAIPMSNALPVVERLRDGTTAAAAGYLGISVTDPSDGSRGGTVARVEPDSPAAEAGLEVGDLIVSVDGQAVDGSAAVRAAIRSHRPGDEVELVVVRDGDELTLTATLADAAAA